MAYEIFSIKLYELDEKIRRLHSRIQMSESAQHSKITDEIQTLRKECEETELMLATDYKEDKSRDVRLLPGAEKRRLYGGRKNPSRGICTGFCRSGSEPRASIVHGSYRCTDDTARTRK